MGAKFLTLVGVVLILSGVLGYMLFPSAVRSSVDLVLNLKENGLVFLAWVAPPFSSRSASYVYEISNPKDFMTGKKMKLNLKGPYLYKRYVRHDDISFKNSGRIIKFNSRFELHLDESQNQDDLDETFWALNPVCFTAIEITRAVLLRRLPFQRISEPLVMGATDAVLDTFNEKAVYKTTPRKILNGRKIPLLNIIIQVVNRFGLDFVLPKHLIQGFPENKFGIVLFQNSTSEPLEMWTGVGETKEKLARVHMWRGGEQMSIWRGDPCNKITGTNGEFYRPKSLGKPITIFIGQLCRALDLDLVQDNLVRLPYGLKAYEYQVSPSIYQGTQTRPQNKCYCTDRKSVDCKSDGLASLTACYFSAPIYLARANFKGANERIRSLVDETSFRFSLPEKQSLYLEPNTGFPLKIDLSLLGVVKVKREPYMRSLSNLANLTYAPVYLSHELLELPWWLALPVMFSQSMLDYHKPIFAMLVIFGCAILFSRVIRWGRATKKPLPILTEPPEA